MTVCAYSTCNVRLLHRTMFGLCPTHEQAILDGRGSRTAPERLEQHYSLREPYEPPAPHLRPLRLTRTEVWAARRALRMLTPQQLASLTAPIPVFPRHPGWHKAKHHPSWFAGVARHVALGAYVLVEEAAA